MSQGQLIENCTASIPGAIQKAVLLYLHLGKRNEWKSRPQVKERGILELSC